ncbi:NADH-quinone oxidoreductase subunit J [Armatimonas sp.]|uniref:NADH-quinone oxidoreductase subunit J family protein n=1 Tax=Armatimonas sp. TaxID=1872638 RepID=UPI00286D255C|nr:NADH-quinone oxidoreductase subunit J [Armatimonas sp.]
MILFLIIAAIALATALLVVLNPNPVRSALFLVVNLFCIAGLYLLLNAYFLSAVQVIVYTGAIMVLFLFVIMLLNLGTPDRSLNKLKAQAPLAVLGGLILAGTLVWAVTKGAPPIALPTEPMVGLDTLGSPQGIGKTLYDPKKPWLFPFEVTSILLLIAVIGSVVLARRSYGEEASKS